MRGLGQVGAAAGLVVVVICVVGVVTLPSMLAVGAVTALFPDATFRSEPTYSTLGAFVFILAVWSVASRSTDSLVRLILTMANKLAWGPSVVAVVDVFALAAIYSVFMTPWMYCVIAGGMSTIISMVLSPAVTRMVQGHQATQDAADAPTDDRSHGTDRPRPNRTSRDHAQRDHTQQDHTHQD